MIERNYCYFCLGYVRQHGIDKPECGTSKEEACATLDYLLELESDLVSISEEAQTKQIITDKSINASQLTMVRTLYMPCWKSSTGFSFLFSSFLFLKIIITISSEVGNQGNNVN